MRENKEKKNYKYGHFSRSESGRFKNMYFHERVTQELQTLYICKVQDQWF